MEAKAWKREKPDRRGWWWSRWFDGSDYEHDIVFVDGFGDDDSRPHDRDGNELADFHNREPIEWAGPVEPPP